MTAEFRKPVENLYCSTVGVTAVEKDWSEGFGETWETVFPDTDTMTVEECKEVLDDVGTDLPDPDPWKLDRQGLFELLVDNGLGDDFQAEEDDDLEEEELEDSEQGGKYDNDEDEYPPIRADVTKEELLARVIEAINDEEISGIEDYREAVKSEYENEQDRFSPMMNYYYPIPSYDGNPGKDQLLLDRHGGAISLVEVDKNYVLALTGGGMDMRWDICEGFMLLGYLPPLEYVDLPRFAGKELNERSAWILDGCIRSCQVSEDQARYARERLEEYKASFKVTAS